MPTTKPAWSLGARQGPLRRHKQLVFFACEGLIAVFDERAGDDFTVLTPEDARELAVALARYGKLSNKAAETLSMREEGRSCLQGAEELLAAAKEATAMGDPSDPAVQAFWQKHRPRRTVVSLRAGSDVQGYPQLAKLQCGPDTGRTVAVDGQLAAVDEATHLRVHTPPRKKNRSGLILNV